MHINAVTVNFCEILTLQCFIYAKIYEKNLQYRTECKNEVDN